MDNSLIPYFPAIQEKDFRTILNEVLDRIKPVDYEKEANQDLYRKAEAESDPSFKSLFLQKAIHPDIESKAIIAAGVLSKEFGCLGYGIYSDPQGFYIYDLCCWKPLDDNVAEHFFSDCLKKTGLKKIEAERASSLVQYTKQFRFSLYRDTQQHNRREVALINANNCTIEIDESGCVRPRGHDPKDYFHYVLPYSYDPGAKSNRFEQFLNEVIPGDIQLVVQEFFGTCLVPRLKVEKVIALVGEGHNGKSVLFNAITYALGKENVTTFNINSLCNEASTTRILLQNKLLNYSSDFSGKIWDNGFFKQLASGEPVEARRLYHDPTIIEDYAKLAYNSNSMPSSSDTSMGFRRRLLIVEFRKVIDKNKADPFLSEKLRTEASGILNWMIEGLVRYIKNGHKFSHSKMLEATVNQYQANSDTVLMFMDSKSYSPGSSEKRLDELHKEYIEFCKANNHKDIGLSNFKMRLEGMGYHIEKKNNHSANMVKLSNPRNPF